MAEDKDNSDNETLLLGEAGQVTFRIGSDIYENCLIKKLEATVSSPAKEGGGVYDMKITTDLLYNLTDDMLFNPNGLTKINPYNGDILRGDYIADQIGYA